MGHFEIVAHSSWAIEQDSSSYEIVPELLSQIVNEFVILEKSIVFVFKI